MYTQISAELASDPWFKVVDFLQQNWAVVIDDDKSCLVVFYGDTCGVFDEIRFDSPADAESALKRNGFSRYLENPDVEDFIGLPRGEFHERPHPNGRIYSSGEYWI